MPVNYLELNQQIKQAGSQAKKSRAAHLQQLAKAGGLLQKYAAEPDRLQAWVEAAARALTNLRCAVPVSEPLTAAFPLPPAAEAGCILAADGSQVNPDRHAQVEYGVINIGVFCMGLAGACTPTVTTQTRLMVNDDLRTAAGGITEDIIALRRDAAERQLLAEMAVKLPPPVVALTDGPLELFREPRAEQEFNRLFGSFLQALERLGDLSAAVAGYVDKPRADLLVRLLEIADAAESNADPKERLLGGVRDVELLGGLLPAGARSAIFALQSVSAREYRQRLALHFFYLNVGSDEHPWLARVEIPAWVAGSAPLVNLLHHTLVTQCQVVGARRYPYALHRAHETAFISREEGQQIEAMLVAEMIRQGVPPGEVSHKQALKNTSGMQTRYTK